jgi:hypothetical protein
MSDEEQVVENEHEEVAATSAEEKQTEDDRKSYTQEELDAIITKRLNRERKKWSREVEEVREPIQPSERPRLDQFKDHADYLQAVVQYDALKLAEEMTTQRILKEKERGIIDKYDDYYEVTRNDKLAITSVMADAITDSPITTELFYYLGSNPKEALRIASLSPTKQAREMVILEKTIEQQLKSESKPAKSGATVSKAPPPIKPIKSGDGGPIADLNDPNTDIDTWMQLRRKEKASRL